MKIISLLFLFSIITISTFGQIDIRKSVTPDITIIQKRWSSAPAKNISNGEFPPKPEDAQRDSRAVIENQRENEVRTRSGQPPLLLPPVPARSRNTLPAGAIYQYETKIRNNGDKTIKEIVWEYVFSDPVTKQELGRRQFTSKETIRSGKAKKLKGSSPSPPSYTVSSAAAAAGKKFANQYEEDIKIVRITYADGSFKHSATH